jgi:4-amino-4-deoxychorismate lyase
MDSPIRAWVDGIPATTVPITDRGFQYGDGLFETVRVVGGRAPLWLWHRQRLEHGAQRLGIPLDVTLLERCGGEFLHETDAGVLRITLTRGDGPRGYAPPESAQPRLVCALYPQGTRVDATRWRVRLCTTQLAVQPLLAGLKHLNRLEQVLARREWHAPAFNEGLMCDTGGRVVEGTFTNLFARIGRRLITPRVDRCGVAGVMRRYILEQRPGVEELDLVEADLWPNDLAHADECLLINSVLGVASVAELVTPDAVFQFQERTIASVLRTELERRLGFDAS